MDAKLLNKWHKCKVDIKVLKELSKKSDLKGLQHISFFFGLLVSYLLVKENHKILYVIILMNLLALNFHIYQKYFEPLFLIMIMILFKNSLVKNILLSIKNTLFFYAILICYFLTSYVNQIYKFSFL